jgi:hypothetical protein
MAEKLSKNQRGARRSVQKMPVCPAMHRMVRVETVPVVGSSRMSWECECSGYRPIEDAKKKVT